MFKWREGIILIYLDYSATTPVLPEVLESFQQAVIRFPGNANSLHKLGMESRKLMQQAEKQVAVLCHVKEEEVIFTSSASEANNMALKGVLESYQNRGKHIITTKLEHSSILETCDYLETLGYEVSYVSVLENGQVNLEELASLIRKDTVLISIHHVNSEVGVVQNITSIASFLKTNYPRIFFHVDGTQSVGKIPIDLENIDLFTFSAHKIYGLKGIACLIKKKNVNMIPLIHGGKSQTEYRSGTPAVALMVSLAKALRLALEELESRFSYVSSLNKTLRECLVNIPGVIINSPEDAVPHILNISVSSVKPEVMLHALEEYDIYISTKTACSKDNSDSASLLAMGKPHSVSGFSLRISLSYQTTQKEIQDFLKIFEKTVSHFQNELKK